jgi:clan AA aspartic protease (TIGR02281 family)
VDAVRTSTLLLFALGLAGGAIAFGVGFTLSSKQTVAAAPGPVAAQQLKPTLSGDQPQQIVVISRAPVHAARPLRSPNVKAVAASEDDWCKIATLPSSLVICADPELRAITSERNAIYKAIKARLDHNHRLLLDENQRNWIRTYATTCGVTPEIPPQLPPSPAVRACFKQAGLARNEFLRGYGLTGPSQVPTLEPIDPEGLPWALSQRAETKAREETQKYLAGGDQPRQMENSPFPTEEIPLQSDGGVEKVPVIVSGGNGGVALQFVVDSGASIVVLPEDVYSTLVRAGAVGASIGQEQYRLADGSTGTAPVFLLHQIKVGSHILANVPASVMNHNGDLLLGQSFLTRFASWSMDNRRHALLLGPLIGR